MTSRSGLSVIAVLGFLALVATPRAPSPPPPSPPSNADVQAQLARREYEARPNAQGLQAPNRAHNLRTYFEPTGVRVHDRTAEGSPALVAFALAGLGRGEARTAVVSGEVRADGRRVEIDRGPVVEWYLNSPEGLEQGFTLAERPAGSGELWLELALSGATARERGDAFELQTATGRRLRYAKLAAHDVAGRALSARMELRSPTSVRLVVEDADARYPLVVDPLITASDDGLLQGAQAGAQLGAHVASAGDVNGDGFADVIAGANAYDAGEADEGAAFIFLGSASGIADATVAAAATQIEANQAGAGLGRSVAGAGDVNGDGYDDVIVGARLYDNGQTDEGIALIFLGSPTGIADGSPANAATLIQSNQGNGQAGMSVAGAGDVNGDGYADVIVGAWGYSAGQSAEGIALIYLGSGSGVPAGTPVNAATRIEGNQAGANLGVTSAGAGDVNGDGYADVIVGSRIYDNGQTDEGAAFVFHGSPTGIPNGSPATANALIESDQAGGNLGWSLAGAGDVNGDGYSDVIVGALAYGAGQTDEGIALVFHGSPTGIASGNPATANARIESNQVGAQLGSGVGAGDVNGDGYSDVIVGARFWDGGETDEGAAFVFLGGSTGIGNGDPNTAYAKLEADQANAHLGFDIAGAGDVNGDGYPDVVAGAELYDDAFADSGAVFVFEGGNVGIGSSSLAGASAILTVNQQDAQFGYSLAGAGDVNGDGYGDVIVGAWSYDAGEPNAGAAFIYHGGENGLDAGIDTQLVGLQSGNGFGKSVAAAGDVNGDGYGDVIVGAPTGTYQFPAEGVAYIFHGGPAGIASGLAASASSVLHSASPPLSRFGESVAGAGDVDGDGYGDVIVGAPYMSLGQVNEGAAFVFRGGPGGVPSGNMFSAHARFESDISGSSQFSESLFGAAVAGAGDVNGDGYSDVIIGAGILSVSASHEGAAYVFLGSPTGLHSGTLATADTRITGGATNALLGTTVSSAGDVNGDGYGDLALASSPPGVFGRVSIFHGGPSGIPHGTAASATTELSGALGGNLFWAAGAGDLNGDGYADLAAGDFDVFTFYGGPDGIPDETVSATTARIDSVQYVRAAGAGDVNGDGFGDLVLGSPDEVTPGGRLYAFLGNGGRHGRRVLAEQRRSLADPTLVGPLGLTGGANSFTARLLRVSAAGRMALRSELEACPHGVAFGGPGCVTHVSPTWHQSGASGGDFLLEPVTGLAASQRYRWRARTRYARSSIGQSGTLPSPHPEHGPWRRVNAQLLDGDFRTLPDADLDGIADGVDNCPLLGNPSQQDSDSDGVGSLCDNCPLEPNPGQENLDGDMLGDVCDSDDDNDGLHDLAEPGYGTDPRDADSDDDGANDGQEANVFGTNPLDPDSDDDTALDGADNCKLLANANQLDADLDSRGDACDNCRRTANFDQADTGGLNSFAPDGVGNVCQNGDFDGDGIANLVDSVIFRRHLAGAQTVNPRMPPEP